jgi:predicted ester cyclase
VIEFLVAEADLVVAYMTIARTLNNVHIYRVAGGKICEHWAVRDDLGMLQQLGVMPGGGLGRR